MELGEKLRRARLEAGFSQRALCGDEITRNMLSQIAQTARAGHSSVQEGCDHGGHGTDGDKNSAENQHDPFSLLCLIQSLDSNSFYGIGVSNIHSFSPSFFRFINVINQSRKNSK